MRRTAYGQDDIRPETVVQDMITQHLKDRAFYYTNIFTAQWLRDPQWLQSHPEDQALPDGFLWRLVGSKGLNYAFTTQRLNRLWDTYRLRDMEPPERGYWDEYTDVMKDSYGIGYDFTGYFALMNHMSGAVIPVNNMKTTSSLTTACTQRRGSTSPNSSTTSTVRMPERSHRALTWVPHQRPMPGRRANASGWWS